MRKLNAGTALPPPLELECLKVLWALGEANVKQVQDVLVAENRQLAYTTVMTVLERLVKRQCVGRLKRGRSFVYSALLSRDCVRQLAVKDIVDTFFDGSVESLRIYLGAGRAAAAAVGAMHDAEMDPRLDAALL